MEPTTLNMSSAMSNIHAWDYLVVTSILSAFLALCARFLTNGPKAFTNSEGFKVKAFKEDTRFQRFSHGSEISQKGSEVSGNDPYLVKNGRFQELVITQPEQLREFSRKDAKDHMKPKNMNLGDFFGQLLGNSVGVQGGQKWAMMRAHFNPGFSRLASMDMVPTFAAEISHWVADLPKCSSCNSHAANTFFRNAAQACRYLPFRLIALTAYGEALNDETYEELLHLNDLHDTLMLDAFFGKWTVSKLFNILPTEFRKRMQTFQKGWKKLNHDVIARAKAEGLRSPAEQIYKGVELGDMSETEFMQTMDELLFTNIDVTSTVTASLLINISENQSFQAALREEIAATQSQESYNIKDYIAKKDTLLHYAVMESIRMCPALWFSLPEKTAIDKVIEGYYIPAGTTIIMDWKRLNTTPAIWGSDSELFRPERFASMSPMSYRYAFLRFGFGRERCLGKNIAEIMLKLVLISIVQQYDMKPGKNDGIRQDKFTVTSDGEIGFTPIVHA